MPTEDEKNRFDAQRDYWLASVNCALDTGVRILRSRGASYDPAAFALACLEQGIVSMLAGSGWKPKNDQEIHRMTGKLVKAVIVTIRDEGPNSIRNAMANPADLN